MNSFCDRCDICNKLDNELLLSMYGALLCGNCWDNYLRTPEGKVEYIFGIVNDYHPKEEFDEDFLVFAAFQWHKNRQYFDISDEELTYVEARAKVLGLLL